MSIKKAIKNQIETLSGKSVFLDSAPANQALPYIVYTRVPGAEYGLDQGGRESWNYESVEINVYDSDDDAAETTRNAVIDGLHGQADVTWSGMQIHSAEVTDAYDLSSLENVGGELVIARHQIELKIKYTP